MMVDGRIEPRNVEFLTATLLEGYDEGLTRQVEQYPPAAGKAHVSHVFRVRECVITEWFTDRKAGQET